MALCFMDFVSGVILSYIPLNQILLFLWRQKNVRHFPVTGKSQCRIFSDINKDIVNASPSLTHLKNGENTFKLGVTLHTEVMCIL